MNSNMRGLVGAQQMTGFPEADSFGPEVEFSKLHRALVLCCSEIFHPYSFFAIPSQARHAGYFSSVGRRRRDDGNSTKQRWPEMVRDGTVTDGVLA